MFTGIVQSLAKIIQIKNLDDLSQITIELPKEHLSHLNIGASIAINGTCLTVVKIDHQSVSFDVIQETLKRTNLKKILINDLVNIERAAKIGDEIGGHLLSGHIIGEIPIVSKQILSHHCIFTFHCPKIWLKYLLTKGYVALDGVSLTIVEVDREKECFTVHIIPETLRLTTFGFKKENDFVNLEIDSQTQAIVDSVERLLSSGMQ